MSNLEIKLVTPGPKREEYDQIVVDGKDLANFVRGFTLKAGVGRIPQLILDLVVIDATKVGAEHVEVYMEPDTAALLERAGWTPPAGDPRLLAAFNEQIKES